MTTSKVAATSIPIIDLSGTKDRSQAAMERVAGEIRDACRNVGFFYIRNHGVPAQALADCFRVHREFHALPLEKKLEVKMSPFHRGYQEMASSTVRSAARFAPAKHPNQLESFFVRHELAPDDPELVAGKALQGPNLWPGGFPEFKRAVMAYNNEVHALGLRLVPLLSLAIGQSVDYLDRFFTKPATALRLIHYPPQPVVQDDVHGIAPHTDYGFLTILAQDSVGGLEVAKVDGSWIPAPYIEGTFVINIGDALARWTNDIFLSTPHRVVNRSPNQDRYSVPFFFDPNLDTVIDCFPACVSAEYPKRYDPIVYRDYFAMRLDANYFDKKPDQTITV